MAQDQMDNITVEQVISELKAEIAMRKTVYNQKVLNGSMTKDMMDHKILVIYKAIKLLEEKSNQTKLF